MQATPTGLEFAFPPDVRAFCENRGILEYLNLALRLAAQTFELDGEPRVQIEIDPETDEEAVVIDVSSRMSVDEAVERDLQYTRQWVRAIPSDVIGQIRMILSIA